MTSPSDTNENQFPTVGRDSRADLEKYTVQVLGRDIIDYNKIKAEDPELYAKIVRNERYSDQKRQEELDEILDTPSVPIESLKSFVAVDKPATAKYFYIPVFVSSQGQDSHNKKYNIDVLVYSDNFKKPMAYASKVLPGQTLVEAISNDLRRDFKYDGHSRIASHHFLDTTPDRQGTPLPRHVVLIEVDRFSVDGVRPANLYAQWDSDVASLLAHYGFLQIN